MYGFTWHTMKWFTLKSSESLFIGRSLFCKDEDIIDQHLLSLLGYTLLQAKPTRRPSHRSSDIL